MIWIFEGCFVSDFIDFLRKLHFKMQIISKKFQTSLQKVNKQKFQSKSLNNEETFSICYKKNQLINEWTKKQQK